MSEIAEVSEEILQEAVDTTYELGRQAGRHLVRIGFLSGFGGLVIGSAASYFLTRHYLETKYNKITEDEIDKMRKHYLSKTVAFKNTEAKDKDALEDLVRKQGYSVESPMAVTPPTAVVKAAEEFQEEVVEATKVEKIVEPIKNRNVFEEARVTDVWDYQKEKSRRSPIRPYVIHYDEREATDYEEITLTYYEDDDVLCNELDEVLDAETRTRLVGENNLEKFGHGSNDAHIVYIRNDTLETQYEVVRSPNSYAKEVHGFEHADTKRRRKERFSNDEE